MQAALSETERGRWFLSEHARRHRGLDTQVLLDAIGRIEAAVAGRPAVAAPAPPGGDISDIARAVTRIRDALTGPEDGEGPRDSLPRLSEAATSDVLDATERIQEAAWTLRERGADPATCDLLDQRASDIYAACAVQDGLARRVAAAVELVRSLEERLGRTRARTIPAAPAPSEAAARPPAIPTRDDAGSSDRHASGPVAPAFARPPSEMGAHLGTLEAIDALGVAEKLRLFT